ncbi:MAG: hypothetical protein JWO60_789 [Frankiales bacterium]|nr:hypothetical protein [Frankiales bacterium]
MKLAGMLFAESAHVDRTLSVQGGGWDGLTASAFPANHELVVVLLVRPDQSDVGKALPMQLHVNHDGSNAMAGHAHLDLNTHNYRQQTAVVVKVACTFAEAGRYTIRFDADFGKDQLSFDVVGAGLSSGVAAAVEGYALGLKQQ